MIKKILTALALGTLFTVSAVTNDPSWHLPPSGPHWGNDGFEGDAEIMMSDVMVPQDGLYLTTYYMTIGFNIGPRGGYCGIQNTNDTLNPTKRPYNNIFSIWDLVEGAGECRASYVGNGTNVDGFGGEGTGIHTDNPMGWVPGQWYTILLRRWYDGGDSTCLGFFTYDHSAKEWNHGVTLVVPETDTKLNGAGGGFIENFWQENGWNPRFAYYRQNWKLLSSGGWKKPTGANGQSTGYVGHAKDPTGRMGWELRPYGTDGIQLCANGAYVSDSVVKHVVFTGTDTKPAAAVAGEIKSFSAGYVQASGIVRVSWEMDSSKGPQFTYEITVKKGSASGTTVLDTVAKMPHIRTFDIPYTPSSQDEKLNIALSVTDIFGNTVTPKSMIFDFATAKIIQDTLTIPSEKMSVVSISSEETTGETAPNGPFTAAIDGNTGTFWHAKWTGTAGKLPYTAVIELDTEYVLTNILLTNRMDNSGGYLKNISVETSADGSSWSDAQTVTMVSGTSTQKCALTGTDAVRFVRMTIESTLNGSDIASLAEVAFKGFVKGDVVPVIHGTVGKNGAGITRITTGSQGLTLTFGTPFSGTAELFSLNGKKLVSQNLQAVQTSVIPSGPLSSGIMIVRLTGIDGSVILSKIAVR